MVERLAGWEAGCIRGQARAGGIFHENRGPTFDGGDPIKTIDLPATANLDGPVRWTPDGRALVYSDTRDLVSNLWSQPLGGGAPRQITSFKSDQIFMFDWSHDGKQLALWRGAVTRNVVLISDFR